ncbi:MAG TPA: PQQ-dependent sugar dehydrogenase [Flavobacteriaceae bacterium]|nr:PQQ-dependent sugar dehydrogenase [Flavobacteriaceae bacterium]MCB9212457.1 PQQ-dependent sugar dehydrogenase [Alteromonas sp.]HPF11733.1 PQQ-dependent sugar dehydrogenase [Flavobacteriaceae bacterium]HQU20208.1 PQQ-dependent sugar dehydrogenase [Flavobacteriaceae bacterium]HQU64703.1 PQQ-dependent sugar dehydrogenase [Flavobacteriaceae bacterium]
MKNLSIFFSIPIIAISCQNPNNKTEIALKEPAARGYSIEKVVDNLNNPWGMDWLPDGSLLITEKKGEIMLFRNDIKTKVSNVPEVYLRGQGGLMDLKLHPNYSENGWIYITYSSKEGSGEGGNTKLIRTKLKNNALTEIQSLYKAEPNSTTGLHFGSRIAFDNEGYLYFSIGERGNRDENPQDITRDCGKIYRLLDDGRIPPDNPFVNQPNAKKAIYSYGHRNPQGLAKHPITGTIWEHEHGPKGGDEINIIEKGKNYGWPVITYGVNYSGTPITSETSHPGMEQPIHYWVPSIAPCGMAFITGNQFPDWKGDLLVGSLKFNYVELLHLKGNKVIGREKIAEDIGRVRNVKMGPDGFIYVAVEGRGIFRLVPK